MRLDNRGLWPKGPVFELSEDERKAGRLSEAQFSGACRALSRFGFVQLNGVLPPAYVRKLQRVYADRYASRSAALLRRTAVQVGNRRFMIPVEVASAFNDPALYGNPYFLPVVSELLGGEPVLTSFGSVCAFPGAEAQHVHVDHPPLFSEENIGVRLPCFALTVMLPLVDLDAEIGTTAAWLGSHRKVWRSLWAPDYQDSFMPHTKLGSVYIMDYRLLHGGTANSSDRIRPILYLVYARPWFIDVPNYSSQPRIRISSSAFASVPQEMKGLFAQVSHARSRRMAPPARLTRNVS